MWFNLCSGLDPGMVNVKYESSPGDTEEAVNGTQSMVIMILH